MNRKDISEPTVRILSVSSKSCWYCRRPLTSDSKGEICGTCNRTLRFSDLTTGDSVQGRQAEALVDIELCINSTISRLTNNQIRPFGFISQNGSVVALYLQKQNLSALPFSTVQLQGLKVVDCRYNELETIPGMLTKLRSLEVGLFGNNQISSESIPRTLSNLDRLKTLDLSYNRLTEIPEVVGELSNLLSLNLSGNNISSWGELAYGGSFPSLEVLTLNDVRLTSLPPWLAHLPSLRVLRLANNQLRSLPDEFCEHYSLEYLDLSNNLFTTIPEVVEEMVGLKDIVLADNPIRGAEDKIRQIKKQHQDLWWELSSQDSFIRKEKDRRRTSSNRQGWLSKK